MNIKATFEIPIEHEQLYVWPGSPALFPDEYPYIGYRESRQGFAWTSDLIIFLALRFFGLGHDSCYRARIEVCEADKISLLPDTIRAIILPCSIVEEGLVFSASRESAEHIVPWTPGDYALVMEMKIRDDMEYINSQKYQQDLEANRTQAYLRFTLFPQTKVEPDILRLDKELAPYPLRMGPGKKANFEIDIEDTQFLVWPGPIPPNFTKPVITEHMRYGQGYSLTDQVISLMTLGPPRLIPGGFPEEPHFAYSTLVVEVWKSDFRPGRSYDSLVERSIALPLCVQEEGIIVSNVKGDQNYSVPFPPGNYELVLELSRYPFPQSTDPGPYQDSPEYREFEEGRGKLWCHLTLISTEEPVQPEILQGDTNFYRGELVPFPMGQ
jgi:hypothetical protein